MCTGQGKPGLVVVEGLSGVPGGMAGQTGIVLKNIGAHRIVLFIGLRFHMTIGTAEFCIVIGVLMAVHTFLPLLVVLAGINGEISIVRLKSGRPPARQRRMTAGTILTQSGSPVIGIAGAIKGRLVATDTGRRNF